MKALLHLSLALTLRLGLCAAEPSFDQSLQQLKTYTNGQPDAILRTVEAGVAQASAGSPAREQMAARLAEVVADPQTTSAARLFLCQQLRMVAGEAQIPMLARMLAEPETVELARLVLQTIPGEAACKALLDGLNTAKPSGVAGIVHSLGVRRETAAIKPLVALLSRSEPAICQAAALALGNIGTVESARGLQSIQPPAALASSILEGQLACAQRLCQAGQNREAESVLLHLLASSPPARVQVAALTVLASGCGDGALSQLVKALQGEDPSLAATAIELCRRLNSPKANQALQGSLSKLKGDVQLVALGVLAEHGDAAALRELTNRSAAADGALRAVASRELRRLRYAAVPGVRASLDEAGEPEVEVAALSPAPYAPQVSEQRRKEVAAGLPAGDRLLAYLDCGTELSVRDVSGVSIRQLNGQSWLFPESEKAAPAPQGTVAFNGGQLDFEVSGLDPAKFYALGCSWWDYDNRGRVQSVVFSGGQPKQTETALKDAKLPNYAAAKQGPAIAQLPVNPKLTTGGKMRVAFRQNVGPNVVVSEIWVVETKADAKPVVAVPPARKSARVLIVTGIDYPGHPWKETCPALKSILEKDPRLTVRVVEDQNFLDSTALTNYDAIVIHFMDWEIPGPGPAARENLRRFVANGGGLVLTHFACGAWDNQEWPEFAKLAGRVWDPKLRPHDPHGKFAVEVVDPGHPITKGLQPFETLDELYTCLAGDAPIHIVAKAVSKVDKKDYPMAFVLSYGQGRVFHSPLGHDGRAYASAGVAELMRRGCAWAAGLQP